MLSQHIAAASLSSDGVIFGWNLGIFIEDVGVALTKFFGVFLYMISYIFFLLIDFLSIIFKSLLGLSGSYKVDMTELGGATETVVTGDFVLTIIQSKVIQNIFLSLSIIALFLLIISVIIAIIRSEYKWDKEGNSKGPIFGKAIRAIVLFFTIPVACVFGIYGVSMILKAVDQATGSNSGYVSSLIFNACAGKGNRIRKNNSTWKALGIEIAHADDNVAITSYASRMVPDAKESYWGSTNEAARREQLATEVDTWFEDSSYIQTKNTYTNDFLSVSLGDKYYRGEKNDETPEGQEITTLRKGFKAIRGTDITLFQTDQICSPYNIEVVWFFYDLSLGGYEHILSGLVSFLILKILFDMACGVVKRAYELVVLYVLSPPVVALYPLDDGRAYGTWVKLFIGKVLMGFGGVLAINFFFMLVPVFKTIEIFSVATQTVSAASGFALPYFGGTWIAVFFNKLTQLLFVLGGIFSLSTLSKMISSLIGAEDAAESGSAISGAVKSTMGKMGGLAFGAAKDVLKDGVKLLDKAVGPGKKAKDAEKAKQEQQQSREDKIKQLRESGDPSQKLMAEVMEINDKGGAGGGGGGGGGSSTPDDGLGNGRIANFLRGNSGGAGGAIMKAINATGKLAGTVAGAYGSAFLGEEGKKGFEEGSKQAENMVNVAGGAVGGVIGVGAAGIKGLVKADRKVKAWSARRRQRQVGARLGVGTATTHEGTITQLQGLRNTLFAESSEGRTISRIQGRIERDKARLVKGATSDRDKARNKRINATNDRRNARIARINARGANANSRAGRAIANVNQEIAALQRAVSYDSSATEARIQKLNEVAETDKFSGGGSFSVTSGGSAAPNAQTTTTFNADTTGQFSVEGTNTHERRDFSAAGWKADELQSQVRRESAEVAEAARRVAENYRGTTPRGGGGRGGR